MDRERPKTVPPDSQNMPLAKKRTGGPRTAAGKAVSRRNAVKHGLSAKTLLPEILQPGGVEALRSQLEQSPRSALTEFLLDEIARHVVYLKVAEEAEAAVLREGARDAAQRMTAPGAADLPDADRLLCAAVTTPALEQQTRFRRNHERGLHSALQTLALLDNLFAGAGGQSAEAEFEPAHFTSEDECEAQLKQRFSSESWCCPDCGGAKGHWLESRKTWECAGCKRQVSLRSGTLFERSALPLQAWFYATQLVIQNPTASIRKLADKLGIQREKTVGDMAKKVRDALADEGDRKKFVGLDALFGRPKNP